MRLIPTVLLAVFLYAGQASGHSWYPIECCSEKDCLPLEETDVSESPEGFTVKSTGEFIERAKARVSMDEHFHICRNQYTNAVLCFFVPNRGV